MLRVERDQSRDDGCTECHGLISSSGRRALFCKLIVYLEVEPTLARHPI